MYDRQAGNGGLHRSYFLCSASTMASAADTVSSYYINVWRQIGGAGIANERTNTQTGDWQLRDHLTADPAGGSDDENTIHARPS
jgi:hypothetical protein